MGRVVALHGVPTSPRLWERLPIDVERPALRGVATVDGRDDWSLQGFVEEVLPLLDADTTLVGHDLGGVIAAMAALDRPVRRLVLCGTALGPYWALVRATTIAPFHRYFYERHAGRRFLKGSVSPPLRDAVLAAFPPVPELPARMRAIARHMRPPERLAARVSTRTRITLIWGRDDRWYPLALARALARALSAELRVVPGGHLAMWEEPEAWARALHATD